MKRSFMIALTAAALAASAADRPMPEWLKRATVYQMVLRNFTRDGNFKSATAMLDHVRSAGVDVVYLTPFVEMDRIMPVEAGNAAFVLMFLRRGLPLLYNGNEIADNALTTFFAPVEETRRALKTVNWGRALQPAGQKRLALIRKLAKLHHDDPVFYDGTQEWLKDGEVVNVVSFLRRHGGRTVFVAANLRDKAAEFKVGRGVLDAPKNWRDSRVILAERGELAADGTCRLGPWGFVVKEL